MTTSFISLTHADIQRWVGSASFQKGMPYFSRGAIYDTRLQGQTLKAHCRGSQAASYTLQATLSPAGIASTNCSCPVGAGGRCKHVAALLLTWVDAPILSGKSKISQRPWRRTVRQNSLHSSS